MDGLIIIVGFVILLILVGSLLGFTAFGRTTDLRREVAQLKTRIAQLEAGAPLVQSEQAADAADLVPDERGAMVPRETMMPTVPVQAPAIKGPFGLPPVAEEPATADIAAATDGSGTEEISGGSATGPARPAAKADLEAALGMRWTAWIGGLALALGGVFLVRYSIEAGLLGPAARIGAGFLFAVALLGLGEWMRRKSLAEPVDSATRAAYIPGILTAAGIVALFATGFAAYALYDFLGSTAAFVLLAVIAFAALALSILHGPAIAGLGLAASYATPILVTSSAPSLTSLSIYLTLVMIATLALARLREWRWLGIVAVVGSLLWSMLMISVESYTTSADELVIAAFIAVTFALTVFVFVITIYERDPGAAVRVPDWVFVALMAASVVPVLHALAIFNATDLPIGLMIAFAATMVTLAYAYPVVGPVVVPASVLILLGFFSVEAIGPDFFYDFVFAPTLSDNWALGIGVVGRSQLVIAALSIGLLFAGLGLFGVLGSFARLWLALAGSVIPLGLLLVTYVRIGDFSVNLGFGAAALALAVYYGAVTEALLRRLDPEEHGVDATLGVYAIAGIVATAAAVTMVLDKGALTLALAALIAAIAYVESLRPVPGMRGTALVASALLVARVAYDPTIVGEDLGVTPIFNWLLFGYGGVALAFGYAAWRFGRTRMDRVVPVFEALGVIFTTLTAVNVIHHAMNDGNFYADADSLAEQGLWALTMLSVSIGMQWLGIRRRSAVFTFGPLVVGAIGLIASGFSLIVVFNPMFSGEAINGGAFDASLILGYLLPALLAFAVAVLATYRPDRPNWYIRLAAALGAVLTFLFVSLAVRAAWHQGDLSWPPIEQGEQYAYSVVWLLTAMLVLGVGVVAGSRPMRLIALLLTGAVVLKVFAIDTAELDAGLRALSFIGLGAILMLVAFGYQKYLKRLI